MIGILIGMIVILVIYNVFALSEGYKRAAVGAADAQTTGLYAQFVLSREIHNAGNGLLDSGIASAVSDLVQCVNNQPAWSNPFLGGPAPIRPTPVLISDGGGPNALGRLRSSRTASRRTSFRRCSSSIRRRPVSRRSTCKVRTAFAPTTA